MQNLNSLCTPKSIKPKYIRFSDSFQVPPTPLLDRIGYGTGVNVYHMERGGPQSSPWALKKINKRYVYTDYADRLKKEASLLKSFSHPNIVGFRGFTTSDDGREVLAMEECTTSLGDLIEYTYEEQMEPFTAKQILKVAVSIAEALHYLHTEKHVIHGDLKSHNVLIKDDFDQVKLCDFGVSIEMLESGEWPLEEFVGTLCWSAPEVLADGPLTPKSDIFSFGLVLWEMIALSPPNIPMLSDSLLTDPEDHSLIQDSYGKRPSLPKCDLGPEFSKIIEIFNACTDEDYAKRPSAEQILSMLK